MLRTARGAYLHLLSAVPLGLNANVVQKNIVQREDQIEKESALVKKGWRFDDDRFFGRVINANGFE